MPNLPNRELVLEQRAKIRMERPVDKRCAKRIGRESHLRLEGERPLRSRLEEFGRVLGKEFDLYAEFTQGLEGKRQNRKQRVMLYLRDKSLKKPQLG